MTWLGLGDKLVITTQKIKWKTRALLNYFLNHGTGRITITVYYMA